MSGDVPGGMIGMNANLGDMGNLGNGANVRDMMPLVDGYGGRQQQPQLPPGLTSAQSYSSRPDPMRAYRACLNCRTRKSKCNLDPNKGRPPCKRCQREDRECVLGASNRGGRRIKKTAKPDEPDLELNNPSDSQSPRAESAVPPIAPMYTSIPGHSTQSPISSPFKGSNGSNYAWTQGLASDDAGKTERDSFHENLASAKLQNPSDALDILAHVAADEGDSGNDPNKSAHIVPRLPPGLPKLDDRIHYKPFQDGLIGSAMIYKLFSSYEHLFHPYFPIIPRETFVRARLPWISQCEPHLFAAILTVSSSKDDEQVHQICYDHMKELISNISTGAEAGIDAIEAMLLLSQWISHRSQASVAIGRGEEDRVAWMHIGTAVRLGYYLGIDRTSFKSDGQEDPAKFNREKLVWLACYLCDRQVSVRLGKAFWSRGPGPLSGMKANDFPTLQPINSSDEDRASIFQANLELTQIFSNCHDILYSTKGHGWKQMLEGRYAKYLDDFKASIQNWNHDWGHFVGTPPAKPSLLLTYDYVRLYVNAFAYQATVARALIHEVDNQANSNRTVSLINSSTPDARFIYEALDAAKELLSHFNNFVDPLTLRCMPSVYYLYVVYGAVFLYKARATTTMAEEERAGLGEIIKRTIERLYEAKYMGARYAKLLQMLWRKSPKPDPKPITDPRLEPYDYSQYQNPADNLMNGMSSHEPHFAWMDLTGTYNYAKRNVDGSAGDMEDYMMGADLNLDDSSPFDLLSFDPPQAGLLNGHNGGQLF